jgi:F0F1-type ATP synthase delta subunit
MKEGLLAQRYARALFTLARERDVLEKIRGELHDFLAVLLSQGLKKEVELENKVSPEILGGIVLNLDGKVLDASVKQQLERLRADFMGSRN